MANKSTSSVRFLNYCKGIGAALTALAAFSATALSVWLSVKPANEPLAKESYKVTNKVVKQLSSDIQKNHDAVIEIEQQCENRIKTLETRMSTYLSGFSAGMTINRTPNNRSGKNQEVNERLLKLLLSKKKINQKHNKMKKRPPVRQLPAQQMLEQKIQELK